MVVLLATGIIAGTTASISRSQTSQTRSQALALAQEGLDLARALRDAGWNTFATLGSPQSTRVDQPGTFTRSVTFLLTSISSVPTMKVTSKVTWGDTANSSNAVSLVTYFTQWR